MECRSAVPILRLCAHTAKTQLVRLKRLLAYAPTAASLGSQNSLLQSGQHRYGQVYVLGASSATLGIDFHIFTATLDLAILGTGE
jgi:hypothetical protein